ncbi:hypothetical protein MASR2M41_17800 [Flammeovirgaceae bacterium]
MFESISWSDFFTAISIIVVGYYVISTLLLFSSEIVTIFKQKKLTSAFPVSELNQNDSFEGDDFMGRARYEPESHRAVLREEKTEAETLAIAPDQEEDEVIDFISPEEDNVRSATQNLIDEVRELVQVISGSSKEESVPLFQALLSRAPQLAATSYQEAVNLAIYHSLKDQDLFQIELDEISSWWPDPVGQSKSKSSK